MSRAVVRVARLGSSAAAARTLDSTASRSATDGPAATRRVAHLAGLETVSTTAQALGRPGRLHRTAVLSDLPAVLPRSGRTGQGRRTGVGESPPVHGSARLHVLDQLPTGQPLLAVPVDRGRLAPRAIGLAHRRDRLARPSPCSLKFAIRRTPAPVSANVTVSTGRPYRRSRDASSQFDCRNGCLSRAEPPLHSPATKPQTIPASRSLFGSCLVARSLFRG
jgi:hypothetical protein